MAPKTGLRPLDTINDNFDPYRHDDLPLLGTFRLDYWHEVNRVTAYAQKTVRNYIKSIDLALVVAELFRAVMLSPEMS